MNDERGTLRRRRRAGCGVDERATLVAPFATGVPVWDVGARYGCHQATARADQKRPLFHSQNNGSRDNQEPTSTSDQGEPFA
jgi:hypothetical protein